MTRGIGSSGRREFIKASGLCASLVASASGSASARALAANLNGSVEGGPESGSLQVLAEAEAATLQHLAEAMVPGASTAGVVRYIDQQLARPRDERLLMLKYLPVPAAEHAEFYRTGLGNATRFSQSKYKKRCNELDPQQTLSLLDAIAADKVLQWRGAPAAFFFFVLRADACDVVYGTEQGFDRIDMPYMAHIHPKHPW
jgi:hypothetical protein